MTTSDDDPTRRVIRPLLGRRQSVGKRILVLKLRAAPNRKRKRGERVASVRPYGHFPAEAAVIERMKGLRQKLPKGRRHSLTELPRR